MRSEYFKAARAGAPPQGEEEAADLALFSGSAKGAPPAAAKKTAANKSLAKAVNLVADADDDLRGGAAGGFGVFRDGGREPPPPSSEAAVAAARASAGGVKAAAAKYAAREVLANLNHHAEVVLRGRPSQVRSIQKFFTHRPVSTLDRVPFQLTGEPFLYGMALSR